MSITTLLDFDYDFTSFIEIKFCLNRYIFYFGWFAGFEVVA